MPAAAPTSYQRMLRIICKTELSTMGHQAYWSCIDKIVKNFDTGTN